MSSRKKKKEARERKDTLRILTVQNPFDLLYRLYTNGNNIRKEFTLLNKTFRLLSIFIPFDRFCYFI